MVGLDEVNAAVATGKMTATALVGAALDRALDPKTVALNACTEVLSDLAQESAAAIDVKQKAGQPLGPLAGIPFTVKDNFLVQGTKTTAAAPFLNDFVAPYTGTCVRRLLDAGAVLVAKTNLDGFAHGTTTANSCFGPTENPNQPGMVAGGSSGGAAAAVAEGVGFFGLGTDTGGSVRLPASFCRVVGYKPTYGWLSRYGIIAMASSTDCPAILAPDVATVRAVAAVVAGADKYDQTSANLPDNVWKRQSPSRLKIGIISQFQADLDPVVEKGLSATVDILGQTDQVELMPVSLPSLELALACYYILVPAEISSNLARYDGLRYGKSAPASDIDEMIAANRAAGFVAENKRRIMIGTYVLSTGFYEAYYEKAQRLRRQLITEFDDVWQQVDWLISPVSPRPPWPLATEMDPVSLYKADLMTVPASLAGLPAISLPAPGKEAVGIQIIGPSASDDRLLDFAQELAAKLE